MTFDVASPVNLAPNITFLPLRFSVQTSKKVHENFPKAHSSYDVACHYSSYSGEPHKEII
jgi:hypothetical protein